MLIIIPVFFLVINLKAFYLVIAMIYLVNTVKLIGTYVVATLRNVNLDPPMDVKGKRLYALFVLHYVNALIIRTPQSIKPEHL